MQIIWSQEAAERLGANQTILELETFDVNGQAVTTYCVVPPEFIVGEIVELEDNIQQHQKFVTALKNKDYDQCRVLATSLKGRFGGELDSFYEIVSARHF